MNNQFGRIQDKLLLLAKLDRRFMTFGAKDGHKYHSQPVPLQEIEHFEKLHQILLPEEFREFLLTVGSGAGPGYGIFSLNHMHSEYNEWLQVLASGAMNRIFPFSDEDAIELVLCYDKHSTANHGKHLTRTDGILPIQTRGCTFFTYLVLTGEQRGKVWLLEIDYFETYPAGIFEGKALTFTEWYENWLDTSIQQLHQTGNKKPWWKKMLRIN